MKSMIEVEERRKNYHANAVKNSVHRASLLVPSFEKLKSQISFLNHFLIKRGYEDVACRITGIDHDGNRIHSQLYKINERKVYSFELDEIFDDKANSFHIEFFTGNNLFIPFPAVMVNHYGEGFVNAVHAYNRVLNDVFEDDQINSKKVKEASVDVCLNNEMETFLNVHAGPFDCKGILKIELSVNGESHLLSEKIDLKRFTQKTLYISELFPELKEIKGGILKIEQPDQKLFYGRLLAGQINRSRTQIAANHSYYDSSLVEEYWKEGHASLQCYPYFKDYINTIRMYPIQSPGILNLMITFYDSNGAKIKDINAGELKSPSEKYLEISIDDLIETNNIDKSNVSTYEFKADSEGKIPTRVNHQLCFSKNERNLFSSINLSLPNKEVFNPVGKKGFRWGQLLVGKNVKSDLGICFKSPEGEDDKQKLNITFYDEDGEFYTTERLLGPKEATFLSTNEEWMNNSSFLTTGLKNIWFTIEAERNDISVIIISHDKETLNCTGEHGF